ncbi:hypothetical protein PAECIP111893_01493 [Paenibacillus plantiphilus]|uniref:histidine kinase n=1 Tax=Paenibacillus plantiphilus TaxID=2905650 RepID=A0ABM9C133_9BACL|nr:sensor histidine kinase [Paenibacillus plantiphilus]CAH1200605.1 hypothetical protein PAECIP111893_01493 [Paenibacillus plantiphilus]
MPIILSLRYGVVIAAIVSTLITTPIPNIDIYMLSTLGLLGLQRFLDRYTSRSSIIYRFIIEAVCISLLTYAFQGYLFILFYSLLLLIHQSPQASDRSLPYTVILFVLFNALGPWMPSTAFWLFGGMVFIIMGVLLYQLNDSASSRMESEQLYDQLRVKHNELKDARLSILEYVNKAEGFAQTEERNRISMEIHDNLGHRLVRVKMMMEAGIELMHTQPVKSTSLLNQVRDELILGMEELRITVRNLKPNESVIQAYSLKKLIQEAAESSGIDIQYRVTGIPYPLYPSEEFVFYRNVQEAITNAIRYANARNVWIHLHYESDAITLSVSNDGNKPDNRHIKKGMGILGMEERVALFGGEIRIEASDRFTITTMLPREQQSIEETGGKLL